MNEDWTVQRLLKLALPLLAALIIIVVVFGVLGGDDDTPTEATGSTTEADDTDEADESDESNADEPDDSDVDESDEAGDTDQADEADDAGADENDDAGDAGDAPAEDAASSEGDTSSEATTDDAGTESDDDTFELEVSEGCAITLHTPIDDNSLSHIVWKFETPGLENGTEVILVLSDGTRLPTTVIDGVVSAEQGINAYGDYDFPTIEWNNGDDAIFIQIKHTVDEREGLPSETCT